MKEITLDIFPKYLGEEKTINIYAELDEYNNPIKFIAKNLKSGRTWEVRPKESKKNGMIFKVKNTTYLLNCWDIPTREICSWFFREFVKRGK